MPRQSRNKSEPSVIARKTTKSVRDNKDEIDRNGIMTRAKRRKLEELEIQTDATTKLNKFKATPVVSVTTKRLRDFKTEDDYSGIMTRAKRRKVEELQHDETKKNSRETKEKTPQLAQKTSKPMHKTPKSKRQPSPQIRNSPQPIQKTKNEQIENKLAIEKPEFQLNDIIWAKIRGHVHWPAKIKNIILSQSSLVMFEIVWYNDYRRSKIHRTQATKFLENFEKFATKFDEVIGLRTAAFEAMYEYRKKIPN